MATGLGDTLVDQGVLTREQLGQAERHVTANGGSLASALMSLRLADEDDLVRVLAVRVGLPYTGLGPSEVDTTAVALLPRAVAEELSAIPVRFGDGDSLVVAVVDPNRPDLRERLETETGLPVQLALTSRRALREALTNLTAVAAAPAASERSFDGLDHDANGNGDGPSPAAGSAAGPAAPTPAVTVGPGGPLLQSEEEVQVDLDELLATLVESGGSDLHLTGGIPPAIRVHGDLRHLDGYPVMSGTELRKMLYGIMTQKQREKFENNLELDMSYGMRGKARFRVNIFQQRDTIGSVMRAIPHEIMALEDLGIPEQVANFAYMPRGFVLVTGPTGSGKSTTLASLIDLVNRNRPVHIMTVEDPIEFLHSHKTAIVNQREVGTDTHGFAAALKHVLRQDPDVILVGEMRDLETIQIALTAAETGHLVFGTLHTQDAPQTVDRVIDVFPPHQQEQIRVMLSGALKGVVCQNLLKTADGKGRTVACEVMMATSAVRNLIREGKTHQIYSSIQAGAQHGMVAMDQSLATLVKQSKVTYEEALEKANNVNEFNRLAGRA